MQRRALLKALLLSSADRAFAAPGEAQQFTGILSRLDREDHRDLRAVVVMRNGEVVAQRYFNGATPDGLNDIRSAGKSITSLLLGVALDRGFIRSVTDPVSRYWPEAGASAFADVSLENILTMRSGLDAFDENPDLSRERGPARRRA
jgi:CubicO group peptidase (beta-lactamase class C family)